MLAAIFDISRGVILEWTAIMAIAVLAIHLFAPYFHHLIKNHQEVIESIGCGLAVAYVFLHLLTELDKGSLMIGNSLHFVVLVGFISYYAIEHYFETHGEEATSEQFTAKRFTVFIVLKWVYSWLIIFALPEGIAEEGVYIVPAFIAISLHILHDDMVLVTRFGKHYRHIGRYVLATAPLVAWLTDLFFFEENPLISGIIVALLAGSVLYNTFARELTKHRESRFVWFLVGTMIFLLLHILATPSEP